MNVKEAHRKIILKHLQGYKESRICYQQKIACRINKCFDYDWFTRFEDPKELTCAYKEMDI